MNAWRLMSAFAFRRSLVGLRRRLQQFASERAPVDKAPAAHDDVASLDILPGLVKFGALTVFVQNYVLQSMQCIGPSMLPTIGLSGDVVLLWPTASGLIRPQIGDVVICSSPTDPSATVCKRIAGMPGDIVRPRRAPGGPRLEREIVVPRGQCWLLGDNANDSTDSRWYGPVSLALVRGVVFLKVWPFSEMGWISRTPPRPEHLPPPQPATQRHERWEPIERVEETPAPPIVQPSQPQEVAPSYPPPAAPIDPSPSASEDAIAPAAPAPASPPAPRPAPDAFDGQSEDEAAKVAAAYRAHLVK